MDANGSAYAKPTGQAANQNREKREPQMDQPSLKLWRAGCRFTQIERRGNEKGLMASFVAFVIFYE
jgi:hypothetical protein